MVWILLFFLIPAHAHVNTPQNFTSPCSNQNHIFFVPGVLASGGSSRACLSRFYPEGQARMIISLVTEDGERVTASRELPAGDGGCLDLSVPQKPNTKADVNINVRYVEANCIWTQRVSVRIAGSKLVVLHTERARYRPGDAVRFRVVALKSDLTPAHTVIDEVWLEGPHGSWDVKAAQWLRVRTRSGLAQLQHDLDELAPPGKWTLRARLDDGSQGSSTFIVGNYQLPPFQLTVRHASKVLRSSERLSWTVCVRYPWSEAVEGMLVIRIRGAGGTGGIRTAVRLRSRACHRHAAAARRVQLERMAADDVIIADFSFQEDGTRIWQNTTVVSQVVENPVTLEFLTKHRPVISSGLPYKLKIKANRWDDKPAANELIHVCRSPALTADAVHTNASCVDALTDDKGVARIMFTVEEHASPYYIFEASAHNSHIRLVAHSVAADGVRAALGPLRAARTRSLLPLYVRLPSQTTTPLTVHFVVITRGGTIYRWGATTQCPTSSDQPRTAARNTICPTLDTAERRSNLVITNSSDLDSLLDSHTSKIMLPVKVSSQMCPDSYLFAYFFHNGELVTASKHFEMEECFANVVEATWNTRLTAPGSSATLTLATSGPALCAVTALDSAAHWNNPPHDLRQELMYQLRRLVQAQRNVTQYDAAGECFLTADEPVWTEGSELAASGVRTAGAGPAPRCVREPQPLTEEVVTRSDFSEAWLWRLVLVGSNGSSAVSAVTPDSITRYEATAFCLAKSGVALSQPAVLQVFREFFIHADGPKRLRRGDTAIMRYRLFNYLYDPISVQVSVSSDQSLEVLERTEVLCIRARSSVAHRLAVTAKELGDGRLLIRAAPTHSGVCGNDTATASSGDEVIIQVYVEPEGVPTYEYKSAMICDNTGYGSSEETWKWPRVEAVPGTETMTIWVAGDLNGPLFADADSLILLPRGCGEQNMQRLATNYLAAKLLPSTAPAALTTRLHLTRGFIRQMEYIHPSGGFSAFGSSDPVASTWLTAFCIRYLRRIHKELYAEAPVPSFILRAERWLLDQQMENGCFRNEGQVFHRELRGGLDEHGEIASVALTAYVIASLMESSSKLPYRVIKNSLSCLRALPPTKAKTSSKIYAHALLTYAFMRLKRYEEELGKTNEASPMWDGGRLSGMKGKDEMRELVEILRLARRSDEFVWWDTGNLATSIEATGYTLLALAECPPTLQGSCVADARAAILWLSTHRSAGGGFISTQDTLVALEALMRWSSILPRPSNLTLRIRSGETVRTVDLGPDTMVPSVVKIGVSEKLSVSVEGTGCALVQATRSYSSTSPEHTHKSLSVDVAVRTEGPFDCDANSTACFCAALVDTCVVWRGALPAMSLLEVALPAAYGADAARLYDQLREQETLLRRIELSASGGKASLYIGTRDGSDTTPRAGHECFKIHAVGPRVRTKSGYAKIIDYYHPEVADSQTFSIPEDCPPRITEDRRTPKYTAFDNLFNDAKSPNGDEILITNDYFFEDLPEGIPLDDPIYDNLIKRNKIDNLSFISNNSSSELQTAYSIDKIGSQNDFDNLNIINKTVHVDESNEHITNITYEIITTKTALSNDNHKNTTENIKGTLNEILSTDANNKLPLGPVFDDKTFENDTIQYGVIEITIDGNTEPHKQENGDEAKDISNQGYIEIDEQEISGMKNENIKDNHVIVINKRHEELKTTTDALHHLSNFHDINYDLEVPSGLEGPVPSIVLPPKDFFVRPDSHKHDERKAHQQFVDTYYIPNYVYLN